LQAVIPASDIAALGTAFITVSNPAPGGGISNVAFLHITNPTSSVSFTRTDYAAGTYPIAVITGDFNRDGKLDLAVLNQGCSGGPTVCVPGSVSILLGNGDGTFQPHVDYTVDYIPQQIVAADFNGDGILDLAVPGGQGNCGLGKCDSSMVSVLLGRGDGTFKEKVDYPGPYPGALAIAAGDFNRDGKIDLIVDSYVYLGNGDGTFQVPMGRTASAWRTEPTWIIGDFNGDGILDWSTGAFIGLGNGDGTFNVGDGYPLFTGEVQAAADFNGDGKLDLAADNLLPNGCSVGGPDACSGLIVLLGNGDGTFGTGVPYPTPVGPLTMAVGDFNGDGKIDLASAIYPDEANPQYAVSLLLGNGDGSFQPHVEYPLAGGPYSITIGDFNGDGRLDLATTNPLANAVSVLLQPPLAGVEFSLNPTPGSSSSATTTAGSTANYSLDLAGSPGFNGTVDLECTGAPADSTCTLTPTSTTVTGTKPVTVNVGVSTTARSLTGPRHTTQRPEQPMRLPLLLSLLGIATVTVFAVTRRRRSRVRLAAAMLLALLWAACGGGSGGGGGGGPTGTPAGTYNLTVTGTFTSGSSTLTNSVALTLIVQ
jgi:uncharacterized protein (DUF2141 family)